MSKINAPPTSSSKDLHGNNNEDNAMTISQMSESILQSKNRDAFNHDSFNSNSNNINIFMINNTEAAKAMMELIPRITSGSRKRRLSEIDPDDIYINKRRKITRNGGVTAAKSRNYYHHNRNNKNKNNNFQNEEKGPTPFVSFPRIYVQNDVNNHSDDTYGYDDDISMPWVGSFSESDDEQIQTLNRSHKSAPGPLPYDLNTNTSIPPKITTPPCANSTNNPTMVTRLRRSARIRAKTQKKQQLNNNNIARGKNKYNNWNSYDNDNDSYDECIPPIIATNINRFISSSKGTGTMEPSFNNKINNNKLSETTQKNNGDYVELEPIIDKNKKNKNKSHKSTNSSIPTITTQPCDNTQPKRTFTRIRAKKQKYQCHSQNNSKINTNKNKSKNNLSMNKHLLIPPIITTNVIKRRRSARLQKKREKSNNDAYCEYDNDDESIQSNTLQINKNEIKNNKNLSTTHESQCLPPLITTNRFISSSKGHVITEPSFHNKKNNNKLSEIIPNRRRSVRLKEKREKLNNGTCDKYNNNNSNIFDNGNDTKTKPKQKQTKKAKTKTKSKNKNKNENNTEANPQRKDKSKQKHLSAYEQAQKCHAIYKFTETEQEYHRDKLDECKKYGVSLALNRNPDRWFPGHKCVKIDIGHVYPCQCLICGLRGRELKDLNQDDKYHIYHYLRLDMDGKKPKGINHSRSQYKKIISNNDGRKSFKCSFPSCPCEKIFKNTQDYHNHFRIHKT